MCFHVEFLGLLQILKMNCLSVESESESNQYYKRGLPAWNSTENTKRTARRGQQEEETAKCVRISLSLFLNDHLYFPTSVVGLPSVHIYW